MKKKVFSLMMMLLLAVTGIVRAQELTVYDGTTTNSYVPFYGLWVDDYTRSEMIYPADELFSMAGGDINSMSFYKNSSNTNSWGSASFQVYLKEVTNTTLSAYLGMTDATIVYSGSIDAAGGERQVTIDFTTPYHYNGGNLLVGIYETTAGSYSSAYWYGTSASGASASGYNSSSPASATFNQRNFLPKTTFAYSGGGGGGGMEDKLHVKYMDGEEEIVDSLNMGVRPVGAWMEPFEFTMYTEGPAYRVTVMDFTPNDGLFVVEGEELPFTVRVNNDVDLTLSTNATQAGVIERQFVAITDGRAAHVWPLVVEMYAPEIPDVWEMAYDLGTIEAGFSYNADPSQITPTTLHNDYTLPFPEIEEGVDAVYKFTVANDVIISANVEESAENGKVALYTEDFYGEPGPMATNNYEGLSATGGAAAAPFEAQLGTGTSTSGYLPFYCFYNYSLSQQLFLAAELEEAGVTRAEMTSLSWYCTATNNNLQSNITIWMANVEETAMTSTTILTNNMTKVYEGDMTPVANEWNEFVFNQGGFAWDGHSNILVSVQRNNGAWASGVNWQVDTQNFTCSVYKYTDSQGAGYGPFDMTTNAYSGTTTTSRANIIMKGGNRNRDLQAVLDEGFEGGSMPTGWTVEGNGTWTVGTGDYSASTGAHTGTYNAKCTHVTTGNVTYLVTPAMDLSNATSGTVSCYYINRSWAGDIDGFGIYYRVNGGAWNELFSTTTAHSSYTEASVALAGMAADYQIGFKMSDNYGYGVALDDIVITADIAGGGETPTPAVANYSAGPVIEDLPLTPGTYYLVASATQANYNVEINVEQMPCPAIDAEGFAFNPQPADNEDEIEPNSVTLRWQVPDYATGWRLIFGTTYHPEPGNPQTVMYPEDGSFTTDMANSYTVRNLWNNNNYFWRVEFNNGGCPEGVSSPVWGFTTALNVPQNLTAVDETVFDDEQVVLNWTPVVDRTYRMYRVYRDGVLIGNTTVNNINNATFTDGPLAYNMEGYVYYVTAVYDEGESAPSNTVTVKVSGYGDVNGHVYEQDGQVGIAGATVTMVGRDEFNVNHTYNFTTNSQGYYSGHIYAGSYNGQAAKDGYQTITEPVQGNPIAINYNETNSPVDYILDENFDPVCTVIAEYYPDSLDPNSPYVKVYWGCGLPGEEIIEPFETGDFSLFDWQVDPTYPWTVTTTSPYEGTYCMKSGGAGVANVVSNMTVTVDIPADGLMSFWGKISCESSWDYGYFYIDGVQKGQYTGQGSWGEKKFDITAGTHTFQWRYTKDGSVNSYDDCFYVDYITFYKRPEPAQPGWHTYCESEFNNALGSTLTTTPSWAYEYPAAFLHTNYAGWQITKVSLFSDNLYSAVGGNYTCRIYVGGTQPAAGSMVSELTVDVPSNQNAWVDWDLTTPVNVTGNDPIWVVWTANTSVSSWPAGLCGDANECGDWWDGGSGWDHQTYGVWTMRHWFTNRAGRSIAVGTADAVRPAIVAGASPINSQLRIPVKGEEANEIVCANPNAVKGAALMSNNSRALSHYKVYRTHCYTESPYTEENTVLLSTNWPGDTIYIDVEWSDLPAGIYKWGVSCVYVGNRGEEIESPINWVTPNVVNRDMTVEATDQAPIQTTTNRAPWDLLTSFGGTSAGQQGVATDGNYIYTASWQTTPTGGYTFYQYDLQGNFIEGFDIAGATGIRDLTTDGQYYYASSGSATIFKLDLANRTLVGTISCTGATSRHCTYDPVRNGLWVGNWSTLALYDMTGNLVFTAPTPTSAYGSAYIQDEAGEDHLYLFCQPSSDAKVFDYNITTNTLGTTAIFDFAATPGFSSGIAGGCFIGEYNGKLAFFGNVQQDPNLIGIYELRDSGNPNPGPNPSGLEPIQEPRESEIVWSNCLEKGMYLGADDVTVNVLLNSADSPEGVTVTFTNYNEIEQELYPIDPIVMDETGFYAFETFRKGEYNIKIEFDGYVPIEDSVSIWEPTDLRYVMIEIIYGINNLYVSSTGWAMWDSEGMPSGGGGGGGGQGGNGDTFTVDFEAGLPTGWTTIDGGTPAGYGWQLASTKIGTGYGHNGSADCMLSQSYDNNYGVVYPDNYLVSPAVTLANGSTFSFYACAQDASYASEHFGVFVSDNGTSNWTMVNEWTMTAKGEGMSVVGRNGRQTRQGSWHLYSVDLSAFAGTKYVAIRHFNCSDWFYLDVDDIELSNGAKDSDRHLEYFKVMCESIDHEPMYNDNTVHPFCQVATEGLVPGEHYICKVAAVYSTGMSDWVQCEWQYIPCTEYAGTVNGLTIEGNTVNWDYPGGGPVPPQPGQGDSFTVDFEAGLPTGWNVIDANNDGYTWCLTSNIPNTWTYYAGMTLDWYHNGANAICSGSYINGVGAITPDEYLVSPQVNIASGSTFSFWAAATDASYPADHFGVFVSDNGTSDWTMVNEWTLTGKSNGKAGDVRASRDGRGLRIGTWHNFTVDLSNYVGQMYIAIRHFNCNDQYIMCVDDIELTAGAKGNRAPWDLMHSFSCTSGYQYGVATDGQNIYVCSWSSSSTSQFYKYDLQGNFIEEFNVAGSGQIRDLTYDGQYFYGVANAATVYCLDLANHNLVSTFSSAYGAMRCCSYDAERDGFWVVGNWSGNLSLISRTGAIVTTGPEPESASGVAYYKDADNVEHVLVFCQPSSNAVVYDYNITTGTYSNSPIFNFSATPGYDAGISGGCHVGEYNGKIAFFGDAQQSPNLIGIYELCDAGNPNPGPTPTGDILGAMIFVDGEWEAFVEYPTNSYTYEGEGNEVCVRMVYNGTNNLPEGNIYYSMSCPECEEFEPNPQPGTCEPGAPIHAEQVNGAQIKVWWGEQPAAPISEWLYYDNGEIQSSVGAGGAIYWGIMFPAASLNAYANTTLTKVALMEYNVGGSYTLNVYVGGTTAPGTLACTQTVTTTGTVDWKEIDLTTPVPVDGTQNVWITFYQAGIDYPATCCTNTGDANGRWVSTDGNTWDDLMVLAPSLAYTWMIRGFVTNQAKGGEIVELPEFKGEVGGELSNVAMEPKAPTFNFMNRANIVKYNVYRSTEAAAGYTLIGEVLETGATYYEYIDEPEAAGTYYYQVRAYYDDDCESEPAIAAEDPTHNYVTGTSDGIGENSGNVALYPNPTNGNVTIEANGMSRITVVSVLGQVVYDTEVNADNYTLNMGQFNAGLYMVRVYTESGVTVKRVTVMQ